MKTIIKLKPFFLTKALWYLVFIGCAICFLFFIFIKIDISFLYFLSMLVIFSGLLIVFYMNRNEPEKIKIEGEKVEFTFFNKVFFKRKICVCQKQELESFQGKDGVIKLYKEKHLVSKIRSSALSNEDWEKVKTYFT